MVIKINEFKYHCPFCNNSLESRYSKCFNVYCQGQKFDVGNLVIYRLNHELGIGRIIKVFEIPASKSLDSEDDYLILKYKVLFENNLNKIIHPIDLIHKIFSSNERIITKKGVGTINSDNFLINKGQISYEVLYPNGKLEQIDEYEIISKYETPIKRIIYSQKLDSFQKFLIKYWANLFYSYYTSYQVKCITNSRLSLMPHQINVAHRLSEEYFPRVILADEVGLGKTIEAGIFIKEMMARNLAERILIIVPATLVKQWQFEMQNKFNIAFEVYDGKKVKELSKIGNNKVVDFLQNPFYYDNLIICSLQFARNRSYNELLSQISWDIVIFDEAHHLRRYLINTTTGNYRETLNYELARKLSISTESLLLLSATPLQLHSFELYSLIELIQIEAFDNFSDFEHFRKNMPFINLLISNVNQIEKLNNFEVKNTIRLLKDLHYTDRTQEDNQILHRLNDDIYKMNLLKKIEKDHTLSKFLIRNRKKNVFSEEFLNKRIVNTIMVNPTKQELEIYNKIRLYLAKIYNSTLNKENIGIGFIIATLQKLLTSSKYAILRSLERRLEQIDRFKSLTVDLESLKEEDPEFYEIELEEEYLDKELSLNYRREISKEPPEESSNLINQEKILKDFYEELKSIPYDSKCDKLLELIKQIYRQNTSEKILIFTQFVDTLFYLKNLLKKQEEQYEIEIFYGGMDKLEKDNAVERFRSSKKLAILISTEIGGEGRNFQFCRVLINYDLPWNPMKLEQRIGRLDRIGQKSKEIYIYNFFLEGTIETDIVFALDKRIHLFEESIGQLEPIIGSIEKDLKDLIFTEDEGKKRKRLNELNRKLDLEIKKAKEVEMQLDDLMIDKKSFQVDDLITSLASCEEVKLSHNELFLLMKYFFNLDKQAYGNLEYSNHTKNKFSPTINFETKIKLNNNFLKNPNYKLLKEYRGTFDLDLAREREDIEFFALGHPLIDNILDFCMCNSFEGLFTVLFLNKKLIPKPILNKIKEENQLYLLIFKIKFQGYILENQFSAIVIDEYKNEVEDFADFILDIQNFEIIFDFSQKILKTQINPNIIENLTQRAKSAVKRKTSQWKKEIKDLNDKIFKIEQTKKEKIYHHKIKVLNFKLESLKERLEIKIHKRPSEKQRLNISNLKDETKKQEKLTQLEKLEEDIKFIEKDIQSIVRKLDDLSFEYNDLKKEMHKRNLSKFYTNLYSLAIIRFT